MSTKIWNNPNDPKQPPTDYKIGTADFEYSKGSIAKFIGDKIHDIYRGIRLPINIVLGALDGNGAEVPTEGKGVKSLLGSC
jgi:hypothetical protein